MKTCFKCSSDEVSDNGAGIAQCKKCSAREAFGEAMPRIVVQPHDDPRFIVITVMDAPEHDPDTGKQLVLDKGLARMLASSLVSIT